MNYKAPKHISEIQFKSDSPHNRCMLDVSDIFHRNKNDIKPTNDADIAEGNLATKEEPEIVADETLGQDPQFIDELANIPVMQMDEFINKFIEQNVEEQIDIYKVLQRRWKVTMWNFIVENFSDECNLFLEIDFGTSRDEYRVRDESHEYILADGSLKHRIRSPVIHNLVKGKPQNIDFSPVFEYRGSYNDLEREKLKISAWKYHNLRLNTLDAIFEVKLLVCANSEIQQNFTLVRLIESNKTEQMYKVTFNLYFQELYDFQLSFKRWEVKRLLTYSDMMDKLNQTSNKGNRLSLNNAAHYQSIYNIDDFKTIKDEFICDDIGKNLQKRFESQPLQYRDNFVVNKSESIEKVENLESHIINIPDTEVDSKVVLSNSSQDNGQSGNISVYWKNILSIFGIRERTPRLLEKKDSLLYEQELSQSSLHPSTCCPRLRIYLTWPNPFKVFKISSSIQSKTNWPIWDSIGAMYFRGTIADLENSFLDIEIVDTTKDRKHNIQAKAHIPLKGLIESSTVVESTLTSPLWLTESSKSPIRSDLATWYFGTILGTISFTHYPLQRQKGGLIHFIPDRVYLLVKIKQVDNIVTFENLDFAQIRASVTHHGLTARTSGVGESSRSSSSSLFSDYIVFPLQLPPISQLYTHHLESLDDVYIDLWVNSIDQIKKVEHAGFTSFTIWDTLFTAKGVKRSITEKVTTSYINGEQDKLKVRLLEQSTQLKFLFPTERTANISFEAFITPDILNLKGDSTGSLFNKKKEIGETIDIFLRSRIELSPSQAPKTFMSNKVNIKLILDKKVGSSVSQRFFLYSAFNHRGNELLLCQFVGPIPSPLTNTTPNSIFHYIRCVPFITSTYRDPPKKVKDKLIEDTPGIKTKGSSVSGLDLETFTLKKSSYWFTPDFTLLNNGGNVIDHCLLQVSMLLQLKVQSFVCIGTVGRGLIHYWVMTWHFNEMNNITIVKFWEVTTGQVYTLKNRFLDTARAREVSIRFRKRERLLSKQMQNNEENQDQLPSENLLKVVRLPYKTIDTIFNECNMWYNVQSSANPGNIYYDLWNTSCFVSCTDSPMDYPLGFRYQPYSSKPTISSITSMKGTVKNMLMYEIQAHRNSQNLTTRWNRDPNLEGFLEKGLDLLEQAEIADDDGEALALAKFRDWKTAMESKVPPMHRLLGFPLSFNHADTKIILDTLLGKLEVIYTREHSATFSIAVTVNGYPGCIICTRVFLVVVQKVSERERRRILEKREQERIKKEEKLKRKVSIAVAKLLDTNPDELLPSQDERRLTKATPNIEADVVDLQKDRHSDQNLDTKQPQDKTESLSEIAQDSAVTGGIVGESLLGDMRRKKGKARRKRKVQLPEGSIGGNLWIARQIVDDNNFVTLIESIEEIISSALLISPDRVCGTEVNYEGQRIAFSILPDNEDHNTPTPLDLMYEFALKVDELLQEDKHFIEFTGGDAVLEWDYSQVEDKDDIAAKSEYSEKPVRLEELQVNTEVDNNEPINAEEDNKYESEHKIDTYGEVEANLSEENKENKESLLAYTTEKNIQRNSSTDSSDNSPKLEENKKKRFLRRGPSLDGEDDESENQVKLILDHHKENLGNQEQTSKLLDNSKALEVGKTSTQPIQEKGYSELPTLMESKYRVLGDNKSSQKVDKKSRVLINSANRDRVKRFTKSGKYIIYKRPEYEESRARKRQIEEQKHDDLEESQMYYPAAKLAISLARGHSDISKKGLLTSGIKKTTPATLSSSLVTKESIRLERNRSSNELLNLIFKGKEESLYTLVPENSFSYEEQNLANSKTNILD
ncbi:hypothetical protein cand_019790 [Cryptosporidium andersoni]|uniref:C2 domain-containing protein n=1 Tax=Cryptosporidium andersoni TaxID=117008 RepID=A0A1J4MWH3_9CRYT|nr:hypothetical protein cand_019790 [Cryptosporidium andersoni]